MFVCTYVVCLTAGGCCDTPLFENTFATVTLHNLMQSNLWCNTSFSHTNAAAVSGQYSVSVLGFTKSVPVTDGLLCRSLDSSVGVS